MNQQQEFPFPVKMPNENDPFYGHPAYPHAIVLQNRITNEGVYAVVMNFDRSGNVRVWLCEDQKFVILHIPEMTPPRGVRIYSMTDDVLFFCSQCDQVNDLKYSRILCSKCLSLRN